MILDEYVEIKIHPKSYKYWLSLGYKYEKIGDTIKVSPIHLLPNSKIRVNCQCSNCNTKTNISYMSYHKSINNGDGSYVCVKCSTIKSKKTLFDKHGEFNPSNIKEFQDKRQKTFDDRFGGHPMNSEEVKEKIKKTNLKRYGTQSVLQNDDIKEKIKKTNLEKYGVENVSHNKDINNKKVATVYEKYGGYATLVKKTKKTNLEKYGVDNPLNYKPILDAIKIKNLENHGTEWFMSSDTFKSKSKKTHLEKYGVDNYFKRSDEIKQLNKLRYIDLFNSNNQEYLLLSKETYDVDTTLSIKHSKCGGIFDMKYKLFFDRNRNGAECCLICNPKNSNISTPELHLLAFIKDNYIGEIIEGDRKVLSGKELDIYLPELKIAFEFNGLYWHSELHKDKKYHLQKTEECLNRNIQLIHVYQDEWINKQEIVKSRILYLLNKCNTKIFARKCIIKNVKSCDAKLFLEQNHIQGNVNAKIRLGLYYNDTLVSLMTLGGLRKNLGSLSKEGSYELLRFANIINTNVIGGASKLFSHFLKTHQPDTVISYADRSWSIGSLYHKIGFTFIHNTEPNYFYITDTKTKENRFKFRKDILVKQGFDKNKTEREIMLEREIYRIYDSGSMKFVWNK
jgi:hypothetical protein